MVRDLVPDVLLNQI
jgi:hypothetical protein